MAFSQQSLSYAYVDSLTYSLYVSKDYKSLQKHGTKALKNNIDFYYLRMRLGISYYEQNNYEKALKHFGAAYEMNPADTIMQEYLYFSLLYTLRREEAKELADNFPESMKKRITNMVGHLSSLTGSKRNISVNAGYIFNTNIADNENEDYLGKEIVIANNTIQGNTSVLGLLIEGKNQNRLNTTHSVSISNVNSLGIVQSKINGIEKRDFNNINFKYAFGLNYLCNNNYRLGIAVGYYNENSKELGLISIGMGKFDYSEKKYSNNAFTLTTRLSKRIGNLQTDISLSAGNLSDERQAIIGIGIGMLYYPFGNTRFYSYSRFDIINNIGNKSHIISQYFGGNITQKIYYEIYGSFGNHANYITNDGLHAYNTFDPIQSDTGINLILFHKNFSISATYGMQIREGWHEKIYFGGKKEFFLSNYNNHLIFTTIKMNL